MPDIWTTALLMIVCLVAEAFFSGSELGIVSADRMKLRHDAAKGSRGARMALEMLEKRPEWLLLTTLVGPTCCRCQLYHRHCTDDLVVR